MGWKLLLGCYLFLHAPEAKIVDFALVEVVDIDVVIVVPVIPPGIRPWVDCTDPIALVLEARVSAHHHKGEGVDAEPVARSKVSAVEIVGNAIPAVASTLLPGAVVGRPVL